LSFAVSATDNVLIALVPTGGTMSLTDDGATTPILTNDEGIAKGIVHDQANASVQIGNPSCGHTAPQLRYIAATYTVAPASGPIHSGPNAESRAIVECGLARRRLRSEHWHSVRAGRA
jgi:hypothetical protein